MVGRRLLYRALTVCAVLTGAASLWALAQNPFAQAYVARSADSASAVLARHMARVSTPERLVLEVEQALAADDMDRLLIALGAATQHNITLPRPLMERALAQAEAAESPTRRITDCAACAWDISQCQTVTQITTCALPVEISPLGDVNAVRRAAAAYGAGQDVDQLDLGLALVGLAATGAVLITAGGSATIKVGATALRLARRSKRLSTGLAADLARNGDVVRDLSALPAYLAGKIPLDQVADTAKLARLGAMADDLGSIARHTSPGATIVLLRYIDSAEDAADMARLSRLTGPQTRATVHLLGKSRAFRALVRFSDMALATMALLAALAGQVAALGLFAVRRLLRP